MSGPCDAHALHLVDRARRIFPWSGAWGSVLALAHRDQAYPHFFERADGARIVDAAGRSYLDWYCGGGTIVLGHRHAQVQAAIAAQLERGVNLSGPSALEVDVGERLVALIPGAEQVEFGKNGTDVTSAAVRLARAVTGRELVLLSGYHGFGDWSKAAVPGCQGIPAALRGLVHESGFNDLDDARRWMELHGDQVAAVVVEPIRFANPAPDFLAGMRELADRHGCLFVLDEVLTGLRVARGGVQELHGVRADLVCTAKALANGSPLSALTGPRRLMKHLPSTQFGLTFRRDALSLAAAKATLDVHASADVAGHLARIGEQMRHGFDAAAAAAGLPWRLYGHPALLHMHFEGGGRLTSRGAEVLFVEACQRAGLFLEPYRLLASFAHTSADVEASIAVMAQAMSVVREAMQRGLEGLLDSPIGGHLQVPAPVAAAERSRGWPEPLAVRVAPQPWGDRPHHAWVTPESARAVVRGDGDRLSMRFDATSAVEPVRAGLRLAQPIGKTFRASVRYRLVEWSPGTAMVTIQLGATGVADGMWCGVRHSLGHALPAWSAASFGTTHVQVPCSYGVRAGRFVLACDRTSLRAWHETGSLDAIGTPAEVAAQDWTLALQVEVRGAAHAIGVEFDEIELTSEG